MINDVNRILWLDAVRTFAIIAVVLVHATENIYVMEAAYLNGISWYSQAFALFSFTLGRLGVPFFLFLTGYLLLDRWFDEPGIFRFWKRNWLGLLTSTEIWIVLYYVFLWVFKFQHWNTKELLRDITFLGKVNMGHMWYMPMIIGVYICIPFAARALKNVRLKTMFYPVLILSFYAFGIPILKVIGNATSSFGHVHALLDLGYSGGVYGLYIIFGLCVKRGLFRKLSNLVLSIGMILSFVLTFALQFFSINRGVTYKVWYDCGLLVLCALFLFELFSRIYYNFGNDVLTWISKNSFGIYLIHFPILLLLKRLLSNIFFMLPMKVLLLWVLVLFISFVLCALIDQSTKLSNIMDTEIQTSHLWNLSAFLWHNENGGHQLC